MKRISFILIALLAISSVVTAQNPRGQGRALDPKERTERMAKTYSLTDEQKKQVYDANVALTEKMNAVRSSASEGQARRDGMREPLEAYDTKLKKILTDKQYAAYKKDQQEQQERFGARERNR
ncbi:hypothetical protein EZS27_014934 [termite gut metagenome]|uniref:DUF4890 domain-containing protein n=1 Tax=termite gut metagenome TaxID=433724 RepID=A0A5J4RVD5_9ZZZZ